MLHPYKSEIVFKSFSTSGASPEGRYELNIIVLEPLNTRSVRTGPELSSAKANFNAAKFTVLQNE